MITQETAMRIWNAYREIAASEKLLFDMEETRKKEHLRNDDPTLKDVFGRRQHLQLGVPSGSDSLRVFQVAPELANSVIRAHIANQQARLVEANELARIEIDTPPTGEKGK